MTQLAADRNTPERSGGTREVPAAAGALLFAGAMAAVNAAGNAVPVTEALGLKGAGRVENRADNSDGAAGDVRVKIRAGIFRYANSAGADELTQADIGSDVYGVDDQTVAKTSNTNTRSVVGKVFDVDDQGVWVKFS
ncbi:hypothetical protein RHAB21_00714 [Pseudorhizobium halotolerans]|uniref:Uncharacterized protein n=1 Tax=Pseudorhizobium halotolerans TaxID=1233081 RepID=A0ABM8PYV6_9HYPH|nr:hypothetical protein [Pseudorhizobium halotolerans]CAD7055422.1 hypothetical protein RHAB21_00714 [Pseudorhizobium halotolerans]